MAHKKGVGSSKNGRESAAQRLGEELLYIAEYLSLLAMLTA